MGIAPDIRQTDPSRAEADPTVVIPYRSESYSGMALLVRSATSAADTLGAAVRQQVRELDAELPLSNVESLERGLYRSYWRLRVFGTLFLVFAVIAMGMAAVGIYAVIAHATSRRTREIGVRLALGADARQVLLLVLRRGLVQIGLGMALGLTAALVACRYMERLLFKVPAQDPVTFSVVALVLFSAGLAACSLPARRAAKLDPLQALRHD